MSDVFISYARPDEVLARSLRDDLKARGYSVWWDQELLATEDFNDKIRDVLTSVSAVVVIWTKASVDSRWVRDEARFALDHKKLISTRTTDINLRQLPFGFQGQHAEDLSRRDRVALAISQLVAKPSASTDGRETTTISLSALTASLLSLVRPATERIGIELWRHWKINRPFTIRTLSPRIIRDVTFDLKIFVEKNKHLIESINNLFIELRATGLLMLLAEDAFFELKNAGVRFQFELMYSRHFDGKEHVDMQYSNCDNLYGIIKFLLRQSISEQLHHDYSSEFPDIIKDRTFKDIRQSFFLETKRSVGLTAEPYIIFNDNSISRTSGLSRGSYPGWLYLSPIQISNFLKFLATALISNYEKIRLDGPAQRSVFCEIDKLYIPTKLTAAKYSAADFDFRERNATSLRASDALDNRGYCAVLGDPGGGKSTLAQRLCLDTLQKCANDGWSPLAVRVEIRRFNQVTRWNPTDALREFITNEIRRQANLSQHEIDLSEVIDHLFFYGRMLVIFDGLDKILNVAKRTAIISDITAFTRRFRHNRFICTCRRVDFLITPIPDIEIFMLETFDLDDIKAYYRFASRYVFDKSDDDIILEEPGFIKQATANAAEFIKNPLLLDLIVWIYNSSRRVPDNRIELYSECSELLFRRWDSLKDLDSEIPDAHWLFLLVTEIAHNLYLLTSEDDESNEAWLKERVFEFFHNVYDSDANNRARAAAEKFVSHLTGRSWILQERSSGIFEFTHRTFLEYFFARWLDDKYDGMDAFVANLRSRIIAGEWTNPIHLACQLKTVGKLRSAEAMVSSLLNMLNSISGDNQKCFPLLRFIVDSISYLQPSELTMIRIVRALLGYAQTKSELHWILGGVVKSREYHRAIIEGVLLSIRDEIPPNISKQGVMIDWLYAAFLSVRKRHPISFPGFDLRLDDPYTIFDELTTSLSGIFEGTPSAPKVLFDLNGTIAENAIAEAGFAMWADSIFPCGRLDWRIVDFALGIVECVDVLLGVAKIEECPYVRLFSVLSGLIHEQAGYPVWGGNVLAFTLPVNERLSDATGHIEQAPLAVATALAIALTGFAELTVGWESEAVSRSECEVVLTKILSRQDISDMLARFLRDWIGGSRRVFSASIAPRISWEDAFSGLDEGKTPESLRVGVSVEVRQELVPG